MLSSLFNSLSSWGGSTPMNVSSKYDLTAPTNFMSPELANYPAVDFNNIAAAPGGINLGASMGSNGLPLGIGGSSNFLQNYGGLALGALNSAGNLFMGMKQYGMAKDALNESKRQFNVNYDAQRKLTNSRLEDRQRARIAADPNAHVSVSEYMNRYGVK